MINQIFVVFEMILKLFKLWDQFAEFIDARREAERIEKQQRLESAVDAQKGSKTEGEFDSAQDDIVNNKP